MVSYFPVLAGVQVAINFVDHFHGVPDALCNQQGRKSHIDQQGNVTVTEIMHPDALDSGGSRTLFNGGVEPGGRDCLKNPFVWIRLIYLCKHALDFIHKKARNWNSAPAVF